MASVTEYGKRLAARETVLKSGQIVFRDSVIDCVVLDLSAEGARVRTGGLVAVPEQVTLRMRGGAVFAAVRRWARGTEIGLAFSGAVSLVDERAQEALLICRALREEGLDEALRRLRAANCFDDPDLRRMVDEADAVRARLEAALRARAGGRA